jgi:hypothetical protein
MKFQTEAELVSTLRQKLESTYNRDSIKIFEEVSLGYGIADIVVCEYNKPITRTSTVVLNHSDINIYHIIRTLGKVSFDKLFDTTRSSKKAISDSLNTLIKGKYIKPIEDSFIIDNCYELPFRNNFAIEAKLKNWKRALYQAYRYKWFAEFAYVVIDAHYAEPALQNLNMFTKYNVGLASISTEGCLIRHFTPVRHKPFDPIMQILFSEMIKNDYELAK